MITGHILPVDRSWTEGLATEAQLFIDNGLDRHHRPGLTGQSFGLRGKMARHADVEPVMDSGGQIDDFDGHGIVLCNSQGSRAISQRTQAAPFRNGAFEINVRCGDVTHRWAAQQCLIRMVRLQ